MLVNCVGNNEKLKKNNDPLTVLEAFATDCEAILYNHDNLKPKPINNFKMLFFFFGYSYFPYHFVARMI